MRPTRGSRRRERTFTGCWKCRSRKIKCDEARPSCLNCRRLGASCSGYNPKFAWVVQDQPQPLRSEGRRILPSELTWAGFEILTDDVIEFLISSCDEDSNSAPHWIQYRQPDWTRIYNPFAVFASRPEQLSPRVELKGPSWIEDTQSLLPSLHSMASSFEEERFLFYHYMTHVACMMLPYENPRNPWKCHWPAAALDLASSGQEMLYMAMLAHSAFNIAHLRGSDTGIIEAGLKYYYKALSRLQSDLEQAASNLSVLLASVMSLMFAETYRGQSTDWKCHFRGARTLSSFSDACHWMSSDLARSSIQSLEIIEIIAGSSSRFNQSSIEGAHSSAACCLGSAITSSKPDFLPTIGAPRCVLECIAKITQFGDVSARDVSQTATNELLHEILSCLKWVESDSGLIPNDPPEARHQAEAFISATYIYCYRILLDIPPHAIRSHVTNTMRQVSAFLSTSAGNFSAWPAFIAAAEAYTQEDLNMAQEWLNSATSVGMGSRNSMKTVLHEIWRRREVLSTQIAMDPGKITIDWKQVMHELGCDTLLI